jgi:Arc/MetJ-type ribon-helix-helix transcriptional regulator
MKHFIDTQGTTGGYSSVSEYIRGLVRDAQQRQARTRLESLLLEVVDNGDITGLPPEDWDAIRREGLARFRARFAGKSDSLFSAT